MSIPKRERTRLTIISAALETFTKVGIVNTRMEQIAERAGVSRAALFQHFPGKAHLIAAIIDQMDSGFTDLIDKFCGTDCSTAERITKVMAECARQLDARSDLYRPLFGMIEENYTVYGHDRTSKMREWTLKLLGGSAGADDIRKDVDVEVFAELIAGAYINVIEHWRTIEGYPLRKRMTAVGHLVAEMIEPRRPAPATRTTAAKRISSKKTPSRKPRRSA